MSNYNTSRSIWRHVFFMERVLSCMVKKVFSSEDELRQELREHGRESDQDMVTLYFYDDNRISGQARPSSANPAESVTASE